MGSDTYTDLMRWYRRETRDNALAFSPPPSESNNAQQCQSKTSYVLLRVMCSLTPILSMNQVFANAALPIARVISVPDLFTEIVHSALDVYPPSPRRLGAAVAVSHVSFSCRAVCLGTPTLWARQIGLLPLAIAEFLARSGPALLDIKWTSRPSLMSLDGIDSSSMLAIGLSWCVTVPVYIRFRDRLTFRKEASSPRDCGWPCHNSHGHGCERNHRRAVARSFPSPQPIFLWLLV